MFLIIGSKEEYHSNFMYEAIKHKNLDVEFLDSRKYPNEVSLTYSPDMEGYIEIDKRKIPFSDIEGVYWRWYYGISYKNAETEHASNMIYRENTCALESFFMSLKCNWVNPKKAIDLHKLKVHQLNLLKENNIRIPKTLITNNPDEVIDFYKNNNKNVIYKPVLGGAMTKKLTEKDLNKKHLDELKDCPIQLQEYIDGVDIRVFAMGSEIFPAEIRAKTIDFREDENHEIIPVKLPENIEKDCLKTLELLYLKYSGIDIRKTKEGEYVFIEANPAPMFVYFEKMTKYPITETLIKLLQGKA